MSDEHPQSTVWEFTRTYADNISALVENLNTYGGWELAQIVHDPHTDNWNAILKRPKP